ncbi:MAG: HEAT repeat domain-containing protein [Capsulimonas sp.]|uniref:HEAT repeat domain-containing protein n=1 Tax=Capsulimonas sp. TaxID=2494211 RepID=UPI003263F3E4
MNDYTSIEWLIAYSRTGNTPRARDARLALAERGDAALPFLLDGVLDDTLPGGDELVTIIGEIGDAESMKRLQEFVFTRENYAKGLYKGGGDNAARALIEILNAPHLRRLRAAVCEALRKTGAAPAVPVLIGVIHDDPGHPTACVAVRALAEFSRDGANEAKVAAAKSAHPYLRAAALFCLETDEQMAALKDDDPYVRLTAVKYLSHPDAIPVDPWEAAPLRDCIAELKEDLKSSDKTIAAVAAVTLAQSQATETEEAIIDYLCFGSIPEVKRVAAVALGYVGTDDAIPELLRALTMEKNDGVLRAAAEALYRIGTYQCRAALIEAKPLVSALMCETIDGFLVV